MLNFFRKTKNITVEEIHAEFDSAEQKILDECDILLAELKIPTETQIERKAKLLEELGFTSSETIIQANKLKEQALQVENKIKLTKQQADLIRDLKFKYPLEKFITVEVLERICNKYNLIHAPAGNYIKDIPEKNILEMRNCKKLDEKDKAGSIQILQLQKEHFYLPTPKYIINACIKGIELEGIVHNSGNTNECLNHHFKLDRHTNFYEYNTLEYKITTIDKSGLFIAAPKSHFNLENLDKKSKYGYFSVAEQEVKDPVVFEYCKNNICRIITKWGTSDDQAYLDPLLTNEIEN